MREQAAVVALAPAGHRHTTTHAVDRVVGERADHEARHRQADERDSTSPGNTPDRKARATNRRYTTRGTCRTRTREGHAHPAVLEVLRSRDGQRVARAQDTRDARTGGSRVSKTVANADDGRFPAQGTRARSRSRRRRRESTRQKRLALLVAVEDVEQRRFACARARHYGRERRARRGRVYKLALDREGHH